MRSATFERMDTVVILMLAAGQQVWVESQMSEIEGADSSFGMYSWFSGHLIFAQ